jgi:hypothetical protein
VYVDPEYVLPPSRRPSRGPSRARTFLGSFRGTRPWDARWAAWDRRREVGSSRAGADVDYRLDAVPRVLRVGRVHPWASPGRRSRTVLERRPVVGHRAHRCDGQGQVRNAGHDHELNDQTAKTSPTRTGASYIPTESEFEEITADTLPGSHFVRTWSGGAGSTREVGTLRGTRAREGWDRTREAGITLPDPRRRFSRRRDGRGKLGSPRRSPGPGVGGPLCAGSEAGRWDRPPGPARRPLPGRPSRRGKLGSACGKLGSECPYGGMDQ